jgi:succinate-semialdehyde dehydrogenase/glutarate-semialdehyde dehydrogenase
MPRETLTATSTPVSSAGPAAVPPVGLPTPAPHPLHAALDAATVAALAERVVASPRAARRTTTAPFTGLPLVTLPVSTADDVELAVSSARAAQRRWAARPVRERAAVLLRLHDLVLEHQGEALDLIQLESGKSRAHAFEEVADVAIVARHYARSGPGLLADRRRAGLVPLLSTTIEVRHPKGVVGIVAPWNYPLTLAVSDAVPALLAGNAVVLKPDSQTPLTALWAARLLERAGLPEGLLQVVVGEGAVVGTALVETCDYVCFTGSTATGRLIAERAGRRLIGSSLELGGKNSLYVADDVDVDVAAEGAARTSFASAGQLCVSTERLLVHERVADRFVEAFVRRTRALRLGAGLDFSCDVGCLVSAAQLERVSAHVDGAVATGATVLAGGRARPDLGPLFYEPTVLDGVPATAACWNEETFGPVVSIRRVCGDDEAVAIANDTEYGLNASVWARDTRRGRAVARRIMAGTVNVNEGYVAAWASAGAPMGGMKASGLSRRHGAEGLTKYTESQTVAVQRLAHAGLGYSRVFDLDAALWTRGFTAGLKVLKATGRR